MCMMPAPERALSPDISVLMSRLRAGEAKAAEALVDLFYDESRRFAAAKMRAERQNHTWQPTALVNELYLELLKIKGLKEGAEGRAGSDVPRFTQPVMIEDFKTSANSLGVSLTSCCGGYRDY